MSFEEFFKKKRVDLPALQQSEPALFSEFKTHFEQMGEKSFDHTKKYWFNKIRRQYPLAPEVKTEKVHIENPVAEQTVIESLAEPASPPTAKLGFVPKFKAANMAKPAASTEEKKEDEATPPPAKLGFVPKFKAANPPKPVAPAEEKSKEDAVTPPTEDSAAPKPAYKPRFNMKNIPPKPPES
ncbi:MAG TPA: hypothetical protein VNW95_02170 [Mucilaginibacter sp.]|jgi:hypothetical protein|nr:hypothetical protein [Mucilaginibacter sp.]